MESSREETADEQYFGGPRGAAALGIGYLLAGVGLAYSLLTDSTELFGAVLVAILLMVLLSLALLVRREGLATPENKLIGVFVLAAIGCLLALTAHTDLPQPVVFVVVFAVGVIAPRLLLQYSSSGGRI